MNYNITCVLTWEISENKKGMTLTIPPEWKKQILVKIIWPSLINDCYSIFPLKMIIDGVTQPIQVDSVILKSILNKYMLKKLIWYHSMKKIGYLTKHVYSDLSNYFNGFKIINIQYLNFEENIYISS